MEDFAIVTCCGERILPEFMLMLRSLRMFLGKVPVIVAGSNGDGAVMKAIEKEENVEGILLGTDYRLIDVGYDKAEVIRHGLEKYRSVLYCDTDVFFIGSFADQINGMVLSNHHIKLENAAAVGEFNAGYMGVQWNGFPNWFRTQHDVDKRSFREQLCLGLVQGACIEAGVTFRQFQEQHNIGWWRLRIRPDGYPFDFAVGGEEICFNGKTATSVHTHILRMPYHCPNTPFAAPFNAIVYEMLGASKDPRHKELHERLKGGHF